MWADNPVNKRRLSDTKKSPVIKKLFIGFLFICGICFTFGSELKEEPSAQEKSRKLLYGMLGKLPDRNRPITVRSSTPRTTDTYLVEKLLLDLNGAEDVPAYFIKPRTHTGRLPVILYCHTHKNNRTVGKNEVIDGIELLQKPPYAELLVNMGYAVLCVDNWLFGERTAKRESRFFGETMWYGEVLWGKMVFDNLRAVDYLASRPDVDPERIGAMGFSTGSAMAFWVTALDTRIKAYIDICGLTDYETLLEKHALEQNKNYFYVPGLLKHFNTEKMNELVTPRARLSLVCNLDPLTPVEGVEKIDKQLKKSYGDFNASGLWQLFRYDAEQKETPEMRGEILKFIKKHL